MKKIHMSREQLVAEAIDLIAEDDAEQARYTLAEGRFNALVHWEKCFLDGTLEDEHAEFIAGVLAKARKEVADNFYQACEDDMHRKLTKEQD
jgi:hypothetical protein